jgi:probable HAF family extracellular repeat protein
MNEAGDIAGQSAAANGEYHAFLWQQGVMTDLGPLPGFGDTTCIGAFGINSQVQVVGQAIQNFCAGPEAHAFLWEDGEMIDLNQFVPPGSGWSSAATWINDHEQIVGLSQNGVIDPLIGFPEEHAVLWQDGQMIDLGTLGGNQSAAGAINNHG